MDPTYTLKPQLRIKNTNRPICVSAQRKGPSVGIFISKKIRFYKAVPNF